MKNSLKWSSRTSKLPYTNSPSYLKVGKLGLNLRETQKKFIALPHPFSGQPRENDLAHSLLDQLKI